MEKILHNLTVKGGWGLVSFPSSGRGLVVFRIVLFPLSISKSRMRHNSRSWRDSLRACQRCPRDCSGVLAVTFLEGAQGLLSRFVRVYPVFRLHHSRGRRGCSGGLVVASLEETQGLLSRFDSCVFRLHHSRGRRGCSGGLPWAYRPGASFSLHTWAFPHQPLSLSRGPPRQGAQPAWASTCLA
jgi:hypothetical protein